MAKPKSPTNESAVAEAERRLAEAFKTVENQGAGDALTAHAERLTRTVQPRRVD